MINLEIKSEYYIGMISGKLGFLLNSVEESLVSFEDSPDSTLSILEQFWNDYTTKYAYFDPETERIILTTYEDIEELKVINNKITYLEELIKDVCFKPNRDKDDLEVGYVHFCKVFNY